MCEPVDFRPRKLRCFTIRLTDGGNMTQTEVATWAAAVATFATAAIALWIALRQERHAARERAELRILKARKTALLCFPLTMRLRARLKIHWDELVGLQKLPTMPPADFSSLILLGEVEELATQLQDVDALDHELVGALLSIVAWGREFNWLAKESCERSTHFIPGGGRAVAGVRLSERLVDKSIKQTLEYMLEHADESYDGLLIELKKTWPDFSVDDPGVPPASLPASDAPADQDEAK